MPIVEDLLVNLAAGFTQTVLMALGKRVLDDPQQRALKRAYQAGFEAMLRTAGSGLSQAELGVVSDVIGRFLGQPAVASALLDLGLSGAPLDVPTLADHWKDASGPTDLVNIRFDFGWGLLAFQQSLTTALINEASRPDSPLANQIVVTRLVALQGQVGQILGLLQTGPPTAPPAGALTPTAPAPIVPTEPHTAAPPPAVTATLTAGRQPSAADAQPAAAARYHSCFISYASKDQAFADQLYADLRAAGVVCWYAPEDMAIGNRIRKTIYAAIGRLDKLLIILSRKSIASEWVEGEVERAFERERRQNETILFPIRLDDDVMNTDEAWAGDIRRTRHIGDFTRWNDAEAYDHALHRLLRDLEVGCDRQPAPPKPASGTLPVLALHTMRAPFSDFTGRADDIKALVAHLGQDGGTATITGIRGMGGIGKTELALFVAQQLASRYPDAAMQFELQPGNVPLTPEEVLGAVIHIFQPELRLPDALAELQGQYRATLTGKRGLLLLDNAASPEQVRPLLPPPQGWAMLVTSRVRFPLPGTLLHDLELLPMEDAIALLRRMLSDGGRHDLAAADLAPLAARCGRLPLALRLAAGYLTTYRDWSLADYLAALEKAPLPHLTAPGEASVQAALEVSINSLRARDVVLAGRWEQLAAFPAPFDRAAAAAVWGALSDASDEDVRAWPVLSPLDEEKARQGLSALVQQSLLECDAARGAYGLHDLLRECALAAPPIDPSLPSGQVLDGARLRHAWFYLGLGRAANDLYMQGGASVVAGLRQFEAAWPHLAAAWAALRGRADRAARRWVNTYPRAVAHVLSLRVAPRERIAVLEAAVQAAVALGDSEAEGWHLGNLGRAYWELGEARRAIGYHEQALAISREIGDRREEGNALGSLGVAYGMLGEAWQAIGCYEQALAIDREIGDRRGEGNHLNNLGLAYAALGEARRAIEYYEQQLVIDRKIGDRRGEGNALGNLGAAYYRLGEARQAIGYYEQALAISREIGDRRGEGSDLSNLGLAYAELGEVRRAIGLYEEALAISREIGDRRGEGNRLGNLGRAYGMLGEARRAIGFYKQALAINQEIGDRRNEGVWLGNLGVAYRQLGEARQAIEYHEQALAISREIGDRRGEGARLGNLGLAYADLGEVRRAIGYYEESLTISREIGDRSGEETDLGNLGIAYTNLGEARRAINYHEQALAISREIGNRQGEGNHLANLGLAYVALGEARRAIGLHEQALAIHREIGDRRGEGRGLGNLGSTYADLGDMRRAIDYHAQALAISREIGDRLGEGNHLSNLGLAYAELGEVRRAIGYCEEALVIHRETGDRNGEGNALANMGTAHKKLGEHERTRELWVKALEIYEAIEAPEAKRVREWLERLGTEEQGSGGDMR